MNKSQREKFEKAGWKVGSASDFLGLNEVEAALVEAKLALGDAVKEIRQRERISQAALAKLMGSSQSRVAKLENHDPEVSLELQLRALFAVSPGAQKDFKGLVQKWATKGQPTAHAEARGRK